MNTKSHSSLRLFTVLTLAFATAASALAGAPETTEDGLVLLKRSRADVVYRRPGVMFGGYTKVMLVEPQIAFEKDWQTDYNRKNPRQKVTDAEMKDMIARGREMLLEAFSGALTKEGYALVTAAGQDVLAVKVSILDLEASVPDPSNQLGAFNTTYTQGAGSATLVIELYDSTTLQVLARAFDRKEAGDTGYAWGMGVSRDQRTNTADVSYAFRTWADMFVKGLERAKKAEAEGK